MRQASGTNFSHGVGAKRGSSQPPPSFCTNASMSGRGDEAMGGTWAYLDITALGRQETWEDLPEGYPQTPPYEWWIWHDQPGRTDPARPEAP